MIKEVGDLNFDQEVESVQGVTIVDFWAPWCGPCRMIAPIMEELLEELGDKVKFVKVNVDDNMNVSQKYNVASIPTIILFDKGKVAETLVGFRPKQELKAVIERYI
jgi:thioredoxin 1